MGHGGEPGARGVERVHAHHVELGVVGRGAEALLRRLVERGPPGRCAAEAPKNLMPSAPCSLTHWTQRRAASGLVTGSSPSRPKTTNDCIRGEVISLFQERRAWWSSQLGVEVADVGAGGDAVPHPELVDVLGRHPLPLPLVVLVEVHVQEPGQDVVPVEIDLVISRLRHRPVLFVDRAHPGPDARDRADDVPLDDDVRRAVGRRSGAVDHERAAQDHPVPGPLAVGAVGHRIGDFLLGGERRGERDGGDQREQQGGQTGSSHAADALRKRVSIPYGRGFSRAESVRWRDGRGAAGAARRRAGGTPPAPPPAPRNRSRRR